MLNFGTSRRANQANQRCNTTETEKNQDSKQVPPEVPSHLRADLIPTHFLIHRAGDRSPGPCGQQLEEAEVWLPTSLESCWATTTRPGKLAVYPCGGGDDWAGICPTHCPRVFETGSRQKLIHSCHFVALQTPVDGSFAGCWATDESSLRLASRTNRKSAALLEKHKSTTSGFKAFS